MKKKESKLQIKNYKKEIDHNKNILTINNIKKGFILKGLIKDIKTAKEKKKSKQLYNATITNIGNSHIKYNSLKKLEKIKGCFDQKNLNNIPFNNIQEIHRMINEEKKKAINKLNNNISKIKEKKNFSKLKNKDLKENINNLDEDYKTESYKIKNGLYYSSFKTNKSEDKNNEQ